MRRKSLVNFDLHDAHGLVIPLVGLRQNQALTSAIVMAWAAQTLGRPDTSGLSQESRELLRRIVSGNHDEHFGAYQLWRHLQGRPFRKMPSPQLHVLEASVPEFERDQDLRLLAADHQFAALFERCARQFLLFVTLPAKSTGRTIIKYAYDEALTLQYCKSGYLPRGTQYPGTQYPEFPGYLDDEPSDSTQAPDDRQADGFEAQHLGSNGLSRTMEIPTTMGPQRRDRLSILDWRRLAAATGWTPTLIRLPVPAAEACASFHFAVSVPAGLAISGACLLAGRPAPPGPEPAEEASSSHVPVPPADPFGGVSFDTAGGGVPNIDLHIADVPYGSLCRAQVSLTVAPGGWLSSTSGLCLLASFLLFGIAVWRSSYEGRHATETTHDLVSTVVVSFGIGLLALLSQPYAHRMAAKLLSVVRVAAVLSGALVLASGVIIAVSLPKTAEITLVWVFAIASCAPTILVIVARLRSLLALRQTVGRSPWEHLPNRAPLVSQPEQRGMETWFEAWQRHHGFDTPAIRVVSGEGSRTWFPWTNRFHAVYRARLQDGLARCSGRLHVREDALPDVER